MKNSGGPRQIFKNLFMLSITTYLEYAVYVVASIWIARTLGAERYGVYSFTIFFCGLLIALAGSGINLSASNFTAAAIGRDDHLQGRRVVSTLLRWQWLCLLVVVSGGLLYIAFLPPKELSSQIVLLSCIVVGAVISKSLFMFFMSVGKGYGKFRVGNIASASSSLISLIAMAYLAYNSGTVMQFLAVYLFSSCLAALLAFFLLRNDLYSAPLAPANDPTAKQRMFKATVESSIVMFLITFSFRTFETMSLKSYNLADVGYFAIAAMLSRGIADVIIGVCDRMLLPEFSRRLAADGPRALGQAFSAVVRYYWFLGMVLCGLGFCTAIPIVVLLYKEPFAPAGNALLWSLVAAGLGSLLSPSNALQITLEDQVKRIYILVFCLLVSAVGSFALVPKFGLMGGVASYFLTTIVMAVFSYNQAVRASGEKFQIRDLSKILISAVLALVLTWPIWRLNTVGSAIVSMSLYCLILSAASIAMRTWTRQELTIVTNALHKTRVLSLSDEKFARFTSRFAKVDKHGAD
jgi:O-antigen/teichoic acid export membrane protein